MLFRSNGNEIENEKKNQEEDENEDDDSYKRGRERRGRVESSDRQQISQEDFYKTSNPDEVKRLAKFEKMKERKSLEAQNRLLVSHCKLYHFILAIF